MKFKHSRKTFRIRQEDMLKQLREEIVSGEKPAGSYLPSEKTLAEQFGLSNKSVRQVLDILVDERLIEKKPRIGNVVVNRQEQQTITLKLGHHSPILHESELKDLLAAFHKKHPHIHVQDVVLPSGSNPEVLKPYLDHGIIDVMTLNDYEFQNIVETGSGEYLTPLEPRPDIYPFLSEAFTADGRLLAQPFLFSPTILCYNRDHFTENGLPEPDDSWSWDDLFEAAGMLAEKNERIGFYFSYSQRNRCVALLLQHGAAFERDDEGRVKLCGTGLMNGIRFYKDVISNRIPPLPYEQEANFHAEDLLGQGKVSMIITTYLGINHLRKYKVNFEVAPLPGYDHPATHVIAIGLAVNRQSPNLEAARLLVDFLTQYSTQLVIRQKTLSLPAWQAAAEWAGEESIYRPSRFALFRELIPGFRYGGELGLSESEWNVFFKEVFMYWSGLETEESFCRRMEELL
ncbi:multiple sugar transport system substrate-binding protein [Paenibacillus sp. UNCCL117]|uniref:extracellular solute-binding protein n=1 Tax=unclassified Paenibacillus TaxID=185978 RepID=UPI0008801F36|nr:MULTISPECIES: extracellular solute-binding protein [unclassified Paenibacillus]SDE44861.1 multiple sugar transport system substrate-binding protein [Paenibacillus sp. cl123]SFW46376.1 multiple sugar transport system substrate-binding protein [Paenibacillus sp. UNCCL117]